MIKLPCMSGVKTSLSEFEYTFQGTCGTIIVTNVVKEFRGVNQFRVPRSGQD